MTPFLNFFGTTDHPASLEEPLLLSTGGPDEGPAPRLENPSRLLFQMTERPWLLLEDSRPEPRRRSLFSPASLVAAELFDSRGHALFTDPEALRRDINRLWDQSMDRGSSERPELRREALRQLSMLSSVPLPESLRDRGLGSAFLASAQLQTLDRNWDAAIVDLHEAQRTEAGRAPASFLLPRVEAMRLQMRYHQAMAVFQALGAEEIQAARGRGAELEAGRLEGLLNRAYQAFAERLAENPSPLQAWQETAASIANLEFRGYESLVREEGLLEVLGALSNESLSQTEWEEELLLLAQQWTRRGRLTAASTLSQALLGSAAPHAAHGSSALLDELPAEHRRAEIVDTLHNVFLLTAHSNRDLLRSGAQLMAFAVGEGLAGSAASRLGLWSAARGMPALERGALEFFTHSSVLGATVPLLTHGHGPLTLESYLEGFSQMFALSAALGLRGALMRPVLESVEALPALRGTGGATLAPVGRLVVGGLDYASTLGTLSVFNLALHPETGRLGLGWIGLDAFSQDGLLRGGRAIAGMISGLRSFFGAIFRSSPGRTQGAEPSPRLFSLGNHDLSEIETAEAELHDQFLAAFGLPANSPEQRAQLRSASAELLRRLESPHPLDNAAALRVLRRRYPDIQGSPLDTRIEARAAEFFSHSNPQLRDWALYWAWANLPWFPPQQRARYIMELTDQYCQRGGMGNMDLQAPGIDFLRALGSLPDPLRRGVAQYIVERVGERPEGFPVARYFAMEPSQRLSLLEEMLHRIGVRAERRQNLELIDLYWFENYGGPRERERIFQFLENSLSRFEGAQLFSIGRHLNNGVLEWLSPAQTLVLSQRLMDRLGVDDPEFHDAVENFLSNAFRTLGTRESLPLLRRYSDFLNDPRNDLAEGTANIIERFFEDHLIDQNQRNPRIISFEELHAILIAELNQADPARRRQGLNLLRAAVPAIVQSGQSLGVAMELSALASPYPEVQSGVEAIVEEIGREKSRASARDPQ
ncbi:MAG: hypothetical protein U1F66_12100 [bacterium]